MKVLIGLFFYTLLSQDGFSQNSEKWFDKESIASTVFLEKEVAGQFIPHGTGFIVLPYNSHDQIIITCDHVLRNSAIYVTLEVNEKFRTAFRFFSTKDQQTVLKMLNTDRTLLWNSTENFFRIKVNLIKDSTLFKHPNGLDIAAFKVNIPGTLTFKDSIYNITNAKRIGKSRIHNRNDITLGDDAYFIGFPFGIGSPQSVPSQPVYTASTPKHLLRRGSLAWVSDDYDEFLLDAMSFGGNSGSPVFQVSYEPSKPPFYLIGIIIGHLGDNNNSNVNYGLARCLSSAEINKVIDLADK